MRWPECFVSNAPVKLQPLLFSISYHKTGCRTNEILRDINYERRDFLKKYRIIKRLGGGGSSEVYLAEDPLLQKLWAIKRIRKEQECLTRQYLREAELMKQWDHPFLPRIVEVYEEGADLCIVMDYVEGRTLKSLLAEHGVFGEKQVTEWAKQLAEVLLYLHSRQPPVIYRDMKPENIMITREGYVKLIDFGVSRKFVKSRDSDTECLGTVGYAAPEQYGGRGQTDERTDIYGLGIVLYEALGGRNLKKPPYEVLPLRNLRPEISRKMERIVCKCTKRNPQDRYQNCRELLDDLKGASVREERPDRLRRSFLFVLFFAAGYFAARCGL